MSQHAETFNPPLRDWTDVRAKRLPVSMELLQDLLNLPDGACIIDVRKGDFGTVEFLVIDESFPMLDDGAEVPLVQLEVSRVESRWVSDEDTL